MYHIGWFSSGRDEAARQLLSAAHSAMQNGNISAKIDFVFLSRAPGESAESDRFIDLVMGYSLPLVCFSYQAFKAAHGTKATGDGLPPWRLLYDREVMTRLKDFKPQLNVLAGYMLIVGPEMCREYDMINLHPAAPGGPTGTWQEVIWQLMAQEARETGVMMHLATPELDRGPVVSYCTFSLRGQPFDAGWQAIKGQDIELIKKNEGEKNALFRLIRQQGLRREFPLILSTIRAFSLGQVKIAGGKVLDSRGQVIPGYDLTAEIERAVA